MGDGSQEQLVGVERGVLTEEATVLGKWLWSPEVGRRAGEGGHCELPLVGCLGRDRSLEATLVLVPDAGHQGPRLQLESESLTDPGDRPRS